jgi:hypothetical protein
MGISSEGFIWSLVGPSTNIHVTEIQTAAARIQHPNRDQIRSKTVRGSI